MTARTKSPFDLESFLPYRLNRAAEWISQSFSKEYKSRYGLTRPEWRALAALGVLGRITATEIGAHSAMHKTKVSRAVRGLEDRRWLRRRECGSDRRLEYLELTAIGAATYAELAQVAIGYSASLRDQLGRAGLAELEKGLDAIESAIKKSTHAKR